MSIIKKYLFLLSLFSLVIPCSAFANSHSGMNKAYVVHVTLAVTGKKNPELTETLNFGIGEPGSCTIQKHAWTTKIGRVCDHCQASIYDNLYITQAAGSLAYTCAQEIWENADGKKVSIEYKMTKNGYTYGPANPLVQEIDFR